MKNWKQQNVFKEEDVAQQCISVRLVINRKITNGENIAKARLREIDFQETQDFPTDSLCCSRISIQSVLALIAPNEWKVKLIDVKTAFLQGKKIERKFYVRPPKEANTINLWEFQKCVYGLADTSRYWYFRVIQKLLNLGAKLSSADPG